MVIPEAAVDAAARAILQGVHGEATIQELAELALEAAAPHLMAEAFEQGQKSGIRHATRLAAAVRMGRPDLPGPMSPNPYRSPATRPNVGNIS